MLKNSSMYLSGCLEIAMMILLAFGLVGCTQEIEVIDDIIVIDNSYMNYLTEEEILEEYRAENEYKLLPSRGEILQDVDLEGSWSSSRGFDFTTIHFGKLINGKRVVKFKSGGCIASWELSRLAQYSNGVITLNRPVKEYMPAMYTRLYTIRFNEKLYLVASDRVKDFEKDKDMDTVDMWLLKKEEKKADSQLN